MEYKLTYDKHIIYHGRNLYTLFKKNVYQEKIMILDILL